MLLLDPATWQQFQDGTPAPARVDWLLLSHNPNLSITDCRRLFTFQKVVFDASSKWRTLDRWEKMCLASSIPYERR
jgi:hypothetical protein